MVQRVVNQRSLDRLVQWDGWHSSTEHDMLLLSNKQRQTAAFLARKLVIHVVKTKYWHEFLNCFPFIEFSTTEIKMFHKTGNKPK